MKKLLLSLGAIASVAAPVAAVVACGSTPTTTNTDAFAEANTAISNIIDGSKAVPLTTAIDAVDGIFTKMTTEGDMGRVIKVVKEGFKVELTGSVDKTQKAVRYFATDDEDIINAEMDKVQKAEQAHRNTIPGHKVVGKWVFNKATAITSNSIVYTDNTCQGQEFIYDAKSFVAPLNMDAAEFALIKVQITNALAPKPVVAQTNSSTTEITSTKTNAAIAALTQNDIDGVQSMTDAISVLGISDIADTALIGQGKHMTWDAAKAELSVTSIIGDPIVFHITHA